MPIVPRYTEQASTEALPGARLTSRASPEAFGGGAAGLADAVGQVYQEHRRRADEVAITELDAELGATENALLYDPETGALNKKGKEAFELPEQVLGRFEETYAGLEQRAATDTQRAALRERYLARRQGLERSVLRHVSTEIVAHDLTTTETAVATARDSAILNADDDARIAAEIGRQQEALRGHAARTGKPAEWLELKLAEAESATHRGVVERLLAGGADLEARDYLAANREALGAEDLTALDKAVATGTLRGESQRRADAILTEHPEDRAAAQAAARAIDDPELRDATVERVGRFYEAQGAAERDARQRAMAQATDLVEREGDFDAVPPHLVEQLTVGERAALKAYARQKATGTEPATEWGLYYRLKTQAAEPAEVQAFLATNLLEHRHELSDTEFKELIGLQTGLRSARGKTLAELDGYRTQKAIADDTLKALGIDTTGKASKADLAAAGEFHRRLDQLVADEQRARGRKLLNEEVQALADRLALAGEVRGGGSFLGIPFDANRRAFEVPPEDAERFILDPEDIPPALRARLDATLANGGRTVNDANRAALLRLIMQNSKP